MTRLTPNQQLVLDVLTKQKDMFASGKVGSAAMGPTKIGLALNKDYSQASSSVTPPLKKLVSLGLVIKHEDRTYELNESTESDSNL